MFFFFSPSPLARRCASLTRLASCLFRQQNWTPQTCWSKDQTPCSPHSSLLPTLWTHKTSRGTSSSSSAAVAHSDSSSSLSLMSVGTVKWKGALKSSVAEREGADVGNMKLLFSFSCRIYITSVPGKTMATMFFHWFLISVCVYVLFIAPCHFCKWHVNVESNAD